MATLIKTDGSKLEIQPQNGLDFQLDELQKFVDGYIDIINLHNGDILVINDNGKDFYPVNHRATLKIKIEKLQKGNNYVGSKK